MIKVKIKCAIDFEYLDTQRQKINMNEDIKCYINDENKASYYEIDERKSLKIFSVSNITYESEQFIYRALY